MIEKDTLHRGAKIFMDSGVAETQEHAMAILASFRLVCLAGPEVAHCPTLQAALLTAVNLANRSFLGGVTVHGVEPNSPNRTNLPGGTTLAEAIIFWGGRLTSTKPWTAPTLVFGTATDKANYPQALRVTFDGWKVAVAPIRTGFRMEERESITTSGIVAASLAVSEAFQHLCGNAEAMRRNIALSLWEPGAMNLVCASAEPDSTHVLLPQKLWLLGLGHLGQAYLWALLALNYAEPEQVILILHDFDKATVANLSTSLLTTEEDIGRRKTRFLAELLDARGYQTVIQERPFDDKLTVGPGDPPLLLSGVDSAHVRRQIGDAGFAEIIEAGLGDADNYLDFQIHSFPAARTPRAVWENVHRVSRSDHLLKLPAYKKMEEENPNTCGLVQIAEVSVGVPFVGAFAGGLVIAEAVRTAMMGTRSEILDGSLYSGLENQDSVWA